MKLTLRITRLLAIAVVIGDFFMVTPAIKNRISRCIPAVLTRKFQKEVEA